MKKDKENEPNFTDLAEYAFEESAGNTWLLKVCAPQVNWNFTCEPGTEKIKCH